MSSVIGIVYNGLSGDVDITSYVLWDQTQFQSSAGAVPGTATIYCRDMGQDLSFVTGREMRLSVDDQLLWAGYIRNVHHRYFFDADLVEDAETYEKRMWEIECIDFNVLLDKRVIRDDSDPPDSYLSFDLPNFAVGTYDGDAMKTLFANYIDVPAGFDVTSEIDNIGVVNPIQEGAYESQGTYLRQQCKTFAKFTAPIYYISADKKFHWHSLEDVVKRWGFSDQPNNGTITSDPGYQGMTRGFKECVANEDGTPITNDAMIWGGTVGTGGIVRFARTQDPTSEALHSRWQTGEIHVGEPAGSGAFAYGTQEGVQMAADAIVFGPPGAMGDGTLRGFRYSQWQFTFTWFADDVPTLAGVPNHIVAGDLVTIEMNAFDVERLMPCRQLTMRALGVDPDGNGILQFTGDFALNMEDPFQLWSFLLAREQAGTTTTEIITVNNSSGTTSLGALYQDVPSPLPDGSQTLFGIPFGYISGTLDVYVNGLLQRAGIDFTESNATGGEFTFTTPPEATDTLYVICRTLDS